MIEARLNLVEVGKRVREGVAVRELANDEGNRMYIARIARVAFTSPDRVRDVISKIQR